MILFFSLLVLSLESYSCVASFHRAVGSLEAFSRRGMRGIPSYYEGLGGDERRLLYRPEGLAMERRFDQLSNFRGSNMGVISVEDYGAKGGGVDDTMAFGKAWSAACSSNSPVSLMIPKGNIYLLNPITFSGPCKSDISVMIMGTIEGSSNPSDWKGANQRTWILFSNVNNLAIMGGGTINGNGEVWWKKSCKVDKSQPCKDAPMALTFNACNGLRVESLNVINSQQIHVEFLNSKNVLASSLTITAPSSSPNTDGIHIARTQNITVNSCTIATGDDCISIVSGSQDVHANNIICGPGHGISIGSLGAMGSSDMVSDVMVNSAQLSGTLNGVRIKTWQKSTVQVSNVQYSNIKGTSASNFAVNFNCSKAFPCSGIKLQDINLVKTGGGSTKSFLENAKLTEEGMVIFHYSCCKLVWILLFYSCMHS